MDNTILYITLPGEKMLQDQLIPTMNKQMSIRRWLDAHLLMGLNKRNAMVHRGVLRQIQWRKNGVFVCLANWDLAFRQTGIGREMEDCR
ncbi:MAG: hypothetical protein IJB81_12585 [Clostridia bacterium]|nr:hypothetical protein [Clostridia bacterium]